MIFATEDTEFTEKENMADELTEKVIGAAIEVHKILGPGLLESIYEEAFCHELLLRQIPYARQVAITMTYNGLGIKGQILDLIVNNEIVVELKSQTKVPEVVSAQILSYLRAANLRRGLVINFGLTRLVDGIQRFSL